MTDEDAFIRAIQARPDDMAAKLIYADWLEERGQAARADTLRRWAVMGHRPSQYIDRAWTDLLLGHVRLWDSPTFLALGRLEGLFRAYAQLNDHRSDISYGFIATLIPRTGALADHVHEHFPECYRPVSLEAVPDWETVRREVLTRWMFDSLSDLREGPSHRLAFLDERRRGGIVDEMILAIQGVILAKSAWRLQISSGPFYALSWNDFVLEADDRLLFLHFSFSD